MSVQFNKTGVINTTGGIGENLVLNSLTKTASHLTSGNEYIAIALGQSYMDIESGTTVTISFDLEIVYNTSSSYFQIYNTNNKGPKQINGVNIGSQVFGGETVGTTIKKRVYGVTTIVDRASPTATGNYIEFYSTYGTGNVFKISNLKIEVGSTPTPYCLNNNELGGGSNHGFVEAGNMMKVAQNYIQTTDFIEY